MSSRTCNDLDNSIPDIVLDLCTLDQPDRHIHVPDQVLGELLGQNCDLEDQVVMQVRIHTILQVTQQFLNYSRDILPVANEVEQVQGSLPDGDVWVVQVDQDLLEVVGQVVPDCQLAHGLQAQVSEVSP